MGGAQPLAATMTGACFLGIDVDPARIEKRIANGYCDEISWSLGDALAKLDVAKAERRALSIGLVGNAADVLPELIERGVVPDMLTDQTSAHDPLHGYVPNGMTLEQAVRLRERDPEEYTRLSMATMGRHVEAMLELQARGSVTFDYGNNLRTQANSLAWSALSTFQVLCRSISVRSSVSARGRSAGLPSPAIRKISTKLTG